MRWDHRLSCVTLSRQRGYLLSSLVNVSSHLVTLVYVRIDSQQTRRVEERESWTQ